MTNANPYKDAIIITDSAATKVWQLISEEENFNLKLRAYVTGGGCSGLQYGFSFDEKLNDDDLVFTKHLNTSNSVQMLIDPLSLQYLVGSEIDYQEDIEGSRFIIRNPNAKTTCGCGSSFSA